MQACPTEKQRLRVSLPNTVSAHPWSRQKQDLLSREPVPEISFQNVGELIEKTTSLMSKLSVSKPHGFVAQASVAEKGVTRPESADECSKCDYS